LERGEGRAARRPAISSEREVTWGAASGTQYGPVDPSGRRWIVSPKRRILAHTAENRSRGSVGVEDPVLRDAAAGKTAFRRVTSQAKVHTVFVLCPHGMPCLLYKYLRIHLNEWQMDKMA